MVYIIVNRVNDIDCGGNWPSAPGHVPAVEEKWDKSQNGTLLVFLLVKHIAFPLFIKSLKRKLIGNKCWLLVTVLYSADMNLGAKF